MTSDHDCSAGDRAGDRSPASNTAPVTSSRVRSAMPRRPYLAWMISPCSVKRSRPFTVPGGEASTPSRGLEPPRPTVPPRPWKNVRSTPAARADAVRAACARYSAQREAAMPASLLLSE